MRIGDAGRKSEKGFAARVGGNLTPASGASGMKGDVRTKRELIECKSTFRDSIALKLDWLIKITKEAGMVGRRPALAITFTDEKGRERPCGSWVMIPEFEYQEYLKLREANP